MNIDEMKDRIARAEEIQRYTENRCESLEKENAELKRVIDNDVDKKIYVQLAKKAKLADVQKEQLTKAKEIIRAYKNICNNAPFLTEEEVELKVKAEQFLNSEVEK